VRDDRRAVRHRVHRRQTDRPRRHRHVRRPDQLGEPIFVVARPVEVNRQPLVGRHALEIRTFPTLAHEEQVDRPALIPLDCHRFQHEIQATKLGQPRHANRHRTLRAWEQLRSDGIGSLQRDPRPGRSLRLVIQTVVDHVQILGSESLSEPDHFCAVPVQQQTVRYPIKRSADQALQTAVPAPPSVGPEQDALPGHSRQQRRDPRNWQVRHPREHDPGEISPKRQP